jgi:PHP family Zn ribbon phosphoesterase
MTPGRIVSTAIERGLDIIAITDHNSAENLPGMLKIDNDLTVIPGMEITTSEEAHITALLPDLQSAFMLQEIVYESLPCTSKKEVLYEQVVVNEKDEVLRFNDRLLIYATGLCAEDLLGHIHSIGGIAIASHIDREMYSILTQFGFIPDSFGFDALEISFRTERSLALNLYGEYSRYPWITASDAHHVMDIGRGVTEFLINEPTFNEIRLALAGIDGRGVRF